MKKKNWTKQQTTHSLPSANFTVSFESVTPQLRLTYYPTDSPHRTQCHLISKDVRSHVGQRRSRLAGILDSALTSPAAQVQVLFVQVQASNILSHTLQGWAVALLIHVHDPLFGQAVPHLVSDLVQGILVLPSPQIEEQKAQRNLPVT